VEIKDVSIRAGKILLLDPEPLWAAAVSWDGSTKSIKS